MPKPGKVYLTKTLPAVATPSANEGDKGFDEPWDEGKDGYIPAFFKLSAEERKARCWEAMEQTRRNRGVRAPEPSAEALEAAESQIRRLFELLDRLVVGGPDIPAWQEDAALYRPATIANYTEEWMDTAVPGKRKAVKVGRTPAGIAHELDRATDGWPFRVGKLLFDMTEGYTPEWIGTTDEFFAWLGGQLREPVQWATGVGMVTKGEFVAYLMQTARDFDAVESLPHHPPMPRHCYLHPEPAGGDGTALRSLLDRFAPATEADRDLILAAFLTPFWGGRPGTRPAFLIESDEDDVRGGRGTGKTTLAETVGYLAGGVLGVRPGEDFNRLMCRLMTPSALTLRVGLLDNLKTLRLSWADLEALITRDTIDGYQLYHGDARRPNTLTWFLTVNGASLSKDMAQRCVMVRVRRPVYDPRWAEETRRFIDENRWAIVHDVLSSLSGGKATLAGHSRWGSWESEVLACVKDPTACQRLIVQRQAAADADQEDADIVRAAFVQALRVRGHDPDTDVVFIPSAAAAEIVGEATGEKRATQRATVFLSHLHIPELRKSNGTDGARGVRWTGMNADPAQTAVKLNTRLGNLKLKPADSPMLVAVKLALKKQGG